MLETWFTRSVWRMADVELMEPSALGRHNPRWEPDAVTPLVRTRGHTLRDAEFYNFVNQERDQIPSVLPATPLPFRSRKFRSATKATIAVEEIFDDPSLGNTLALRIAA